MFRIVTSKDGQQLSAYDVARTENAGIYALSKDLDGYLAHGYRIMIEDAKQRKYILASCIETITVQLIEVEPVVFTRFVDMPVDPDQDTTPIDVITASNS